MVRKGSKLHEHLIMQLGSLSTYANCFSCMVERPIEGIAIWSCICSTKTFCLWCHSSFSDSIMFSQVKPCMNSGSTRCIISYLLPMQFPGTLYSTMSTQRKFFIITLFCIKPGLKIVTLARSYFGIGSYKLLYKLYWSTSLWFTHLRLTTCHITGRMDHFGLMGLLYMLVLW